MPNDEASCQDAAWDAENYRLLAENSSDLIARISIEGICLYLSPSCEDLLGYTPGELIGRHVFDFIHPLDRKAVADSLEPEILYHSHLKIVCRLRRKNGYYGWFEGKFSFFGEVLTKQLQVVAVIRDVGDRVRAERFATVRHSIAAMDPQGTDLEKKFSSLLSTICATLTWDMGEIWLVQEGKSVLRRRGYWYAPSSRLRQFAERSSDMAFAPGVGLPGLLWSRKEVSLFDDLPNVSASVRRKEYRETGLKSVIGTVLSDETTIYGVILFLSRRTIQRNHELLDMIEETGAALGAFMAKHFARKSLEAESEKLGVLVEEGTARIRALQNEVNRQQRLEQDMIMAAEVQRQLLPLKDPEIPGFSISSAAIPARLISGDFWDYAPASPGLCDIIIADVSGKGIAAAVMTTAAKTIFRLSDKGRGDPSRLLEAMNTALYVDLERTEMFLTAQILRLDSTRGRISYASAGHTEALHFLRSTGKCVLLPSTAPPIGIIGEISVGQLEIATRPGDFFVVYSDGVTEAVDEEDRLFGMKRFVDILEGGAFESASDLVQAVLAEVRRFSGDGPLADDLTIVVIEAKTRKIHRKVESSIEKLNEAASWVRDASLAYGKQTADELELIASELVTNAIKHADGGDLAMIGLSMTLEPDKISLDLEYPGSAFDPDKKTKVPPDPLQEGGRGIPIVRALADQLEFSHEEGEPPGLNRWHVVKQAPQETDR
ncbi:MAG: SpoIIE family protein phosphatase [Spirochaetes bacterium]|nr:SpoIIE family protein phosphatase [Spirochaetota bacterium]